MKIKVGGMSCGHCKARIETALKNKGYTSFSVSLESGLVEVDAPESSRGEIIAEIEDLGFDAD